jgi:serine/threonine protein kinase
MKVLADPLQGRTLLGRYRVVMPIGRGGMGTVYLARTEGAAGFAKPVVIKSIHSDLMGDEGMVEMFAREARLLSNMQHSGIVNVLDFGEEDGTYIMVLEYVHGYDLGAWCRYLLETDDQLPYEFALHIGIEVLETLHYTHHYRRSDGADMTIIHRDISPGNILISLDGEVKLADFGIARATDEAGEYRSRVGTFKGKLAYSAPELVQGDQPTPRADIYSLGVVLLQILLGRNPFKGEAMGDTVQRVVTLDPPRVSDERSDVPASFDEILARALAKDPDQRYQTSGEFATALKNLRQRPADEIAADFADHVRGDFEFAMPQELALDRLQDRDGAWRHSQERSDPGRAQGLSSTPPPPSAEPLVRAIGSDSPTAIIGRGRVPRSEAATERPPQRSIWLYVVLGIVALGAIIGGVAALVLALQPPPADPPQFVVMQNQANPATTPVVSVTSPPSTSASAAPVDAATRLTQALHSRQGHIQHCFETHVKQVAGAPEVSLKVQLEADGTVLKVRISPSSLEATPLGECLRGVARETKFPAPGQRLTLTLPITARVAE